MTSHVFDFDFQLLLRSLGGALEGHVLQKVRCAVVGGRLVSGSSVNPHTDSGGFSSDDCFGSHSQTVVKGRHIRRRGSQHVVRETRKRTASRTGSSGDFASLSGENLSNSFSISFSISISISFQSFKVPNKKSNGNFRIRVSIQFCCVGTNGIYCCVVLCCISFGFGFAVQSNQSVSPKGCRAEKKDLKN